MISRFFSNAMPRRFLCVLLALLTCFCALSPALVQPAEAVAVADDILLASLGLLAASWAGVTFSTCAGANTAISNLLKYKPSVKTSLAGLITKNLVVDGAKLLLTSDLRDSFKTVLPEIKDFFQTKTGESSGALSGAVSVGVPFPVPVCSNSDDEGIVSLRPGQSSSVSVLTSSGSRSVYPLIEDKTLSIYDSVSKQKISYTTAGVAILSYGFFIQDGSLYCRFSKQDGSRVFSSGKLFCVSDVTSAAATVLSDSNAIPFHQSPEVDGTSALEILQPAPLYVVDPSGGDDKDPTEGTKPEINFKYGMLALEGLIGALTLSGPDAQKDPDIDPKKMIEELKKAMEQSQENPDPNPDPDPDPEPDPDPDPDPTENPDSGDSSDSFDYNKFKLPDLFTIFPFCIPFDLLAFMKVLSADPVAPSFTFATSFLGQVYTVNVDLSAWNGVASTLRYMVVAIYVVSLAVATRKFIKW